MTLTARLTGTRATARLIYLYLTTGARLNTHYQRLATLYDFNGTGQPTIPTLNGSTDIILGPMPSGFGGAVVHEIAVTGLTWAPVAPREEITSGTIMVSWAFDAFMGDDVAAFRACQLGQQALSDLFEDPDEIGPQLGSQSNGVHSFEIVGESTIGEYNPWGGKAARWGAELRFVCKQDPASLSVANS